MEENLIKRLMYYYGCFHSCDSEEGQKNFAKTFAEENKISYEDALACILNNTDELSKCWGCKHIVNRWDMEIYNPCTYCSRRIALHDNFEQGDKVYRTKDERIGGTDG